MGLIAKPRLLYIGPVVPSPSAHSGLAQRAFRILEALSGHFRISLLVGLASTERREAEALTARALCEMVTWLPGPYGLQSRCRRIMQRVSPWFYHTLWSCPSDWSVPTDGVRRTLQRAYAGVRFDCVHVSRLRMLPLVGALPFDPSATLQVDFDDVESSTRRRIADLAQHNADGRLARAATCDAAKYAALECDALARCNRVFVASDVDRARLAERDVALRCWCLPNVVETPERSPEEPRGGPFVFLFVGSLDYYPNADAVKFFCWEVLPRVRRLTSGDIEVRIMGHPPRGLRRLLVNEHITSVAPNANLTSQYHNANVVVVPIRAGGGTRIKALEAFAHGRPVVGTTLGLEGLNVESGTHAMIADSPEDLAAACARLMRDPALRQRLVAHAHALVQKRFSPRALRAAVEEAVLG